MVSHKIFIGIFSLASMLVSGLFWSSFASSQGAIVLLILVGLSLDGFKIHLLSSLKAINGYVLKTCSVLLYGVLALISVVGCMTMINASEKNASLNSEVMLALKAEQQTVKQQLATLLEVQRVDLENNYRARSIGLNQEIEKIRGNLSHINQSIQQQQENNADSALSSAAKIFSAALPYSEGVTKDALSLMASLILEACLLLLLLQNQEQVQSQKNMEQQTMAQEADNKAAPKQQALPKNVVMIRDRAKSKQQSIKCSSSKQVATEHTSTAVKQQQYEALLEKMKQDMCSGRVKASITDCKIRYKRGTKTIQACFNHLIKEGFMKRVNKRYSLNANFVNVKENTIKIGVF